MEWLFGIFVLLVFIALFIAFPIFRIGIVVIILAGWWWISEANKEKEIARVREASLIQPHQLSWSNVRISDVYSSWSLVGRVENLSPNTLTSFNAKVSFYDCPSIETQLKDCKIFFETSAHSYKDVPPNQVRDFSEYISKPPSSALGYMKWTYSISDVKGK